jgi:two-component system, sensor histidine kinase and response regulator
MKALNKNEEINILIVDDNTQNIQVIGQILWQKNYNVIFATSGNEALKVLENNSGFDLILLDILMPQMSGFEVCVRIREKPELNNIPIIFLTAKADKQSIVDGFRKGANDYVIKPFHEEELLLRVETQLKLKKQNEKIENYNAELVKEVSMKTVELKKAHSQLEKLEYAKNNFLALISHELRTPLNIINGFVEILLGTSGDASQIESLTILKKTTNRLISLSKTALLITEIQMGNYTFEKKEVVLHEACDHAAKLLNEELDGNPLEYHIIANQDNITIKGEYDLIVNMLKLIIENSAEAAKNDCRVKFYLIKKENETLVEVHDNGPGFTNLDLTNLFEIFSKKGPNPSHEGFGLSLAAVKLSMDLHGGEVSAKNLPDGGACVRLNFVN